jgi:hypothetical protein
MSHPAAPTAPSHAMSTRRTHGVFDRFAAAARDLLERPRVLLISPGEVDAELARIIHVGASRKRADAKRDRHSEP